MRNIASLMLVLGFVAGLAPSGFAEETTATTTTKACKTVKHSKKHVHKAAPSKSSTTTEDKTETKSETK